MLRRSLHTLFARSFAVLAVLALLVSLHGHGCAPSDCCEGDDADGGTPIHVVCTCVAHALLIPEPPLLPAIGVSGVQRYEPLESRAPEGFRAAPEPPPNRAS